VDVKRIVKKPIRGKRRLQEEEEEEEEDEEGGLGNNPACWVNWQVEVVDDDGNVTEQDICTSNFWVMLVNVAVFYTMFWWMIKTFVLSTQ